MSVRKLSLHADKVVHIIDTYALPLPAETLHGLRRDVLDVNPSGRERLAEEDAAMFLADRLYAMVVVELHGTIDPSEVGAAQRAWMKFTQQTMYRADLGLINLTLFNNEILPLIDDVEHMLRERLGARDRSRRDYATPRGSVMPL